MSKRDRLTMDAMTPDHQPDEGYSEDPLNSTVHYDSFSSSSLTTPKSPAELPAWISANAAQIPMSLKKELALALLHELPTSAISDIVQQLHPRLYINFVHYLPPEICLKILSYLDANSLVCVIRTCRDWCDLALDSKLWERLYHLEGWKAIQSEIDSWEARVNVGLSDSIGHLHRIQSSEGHTSKIRAVRSDDDDDDVPMPDGDRTTTTDGLSSSRSIFGSSNSPLANPRNATLSPTGDNDMESPSPSRSRPADRSFSSSEPRPKRRGIRASSETPLPPILPPMDPQALKRSTLWMWDPSHSRYRINWKYLYDMRRRLESNWELGKAVPFQFPHPSHPEEGHQECIYTLQFDTNFLVSGSRDKTMRIWNVRTRRLLRPPLVGHHGSVLCLQFDADPEEDLLVSGSSDSNIIIWKFSTGEIIQKITRAHRESVLNVRFDKRILVTSSKDKSIKIFNRRPLRYGDLGYREDMFQPVARHVRNYGYAPDLAHELPVQPAFSLIGRLDGHTAAVNAIQIRDRTVVSASGDRHIKVWDWPEQTCTQTIPAHDKGIACVEFDGRRIVSGSSDFEVCIFDAATGLKVAQLRGHAHLVRTVQAGFGDLPYSRVEDEIEARRVDSEYFSAVEAGLVDPNSQRTRGHRRPANAGSSRPEDVQSYGASLPPGGGGGRTYGRIVSGSYDQSVIIWRRDKEGVWKPVHHLRQEEAAEVAQRREASLLNPAGTALGLAQIGAQAHSLALPPSGYVLSSVNQMPNLPLPNVHDSQPHLSSGVYTALIDEVVPAGALALKRALANYPGLLAYHSYLQVTIERESSPYVRAQLRQVVADALIAIQNAQWMRQQEMRVASHMASSLAAAPASADSQEMTATPTRNQQNPAPAAGHNTPPAAPGATAQGPDEEAEANQPAPPIPGDAVPMPDNAPARVFKLQFDARKIICCSQSPVLVGWDFCNGDPELEEASRFFATVD